MTFFVRRSFYFKPGNQDGILVRESFHWDDRDEVVPSEDVKYRMRVLEKFDAVFAGGRVDRVTEREDDSDNVVFLMKHFKSPQATFYRLSNRVLQVNFFDGSRLLFAREGNEIVFIDCSKNDRRIWAFSSTTSRVHLSSLITGKLQYVHDIISSIIRGNNK